jgi:hyperpolarization activated cyclic nucleotide-gated potassium channel 1
LEVPQMTKEELRALFKSAVKKVIAVIKVNRVREDILLFGTSSNIFDVTTRDRQKVLQALYPAISATDHDRMREMEAKDMPMWILHPESTFMTVWAGITILVLMYTATLMPFMLAFFDKLDGVWAVLDLLSDIFFYIDTGLHFFTAYRDDEGVLVINHKSIIKNYLLGGFLLDLISIFPFNIIFPDSDIAGQYNQFARLARLPRLYRLTRFSKVLPKIRNENLRQTIEVSHQFITFTIIALSVLLLVHIGSCIWFLMSRVTGAETEGWVYQ